MKIDIILHANIAGKRGKHFHYFSCLMVAYRICWKDTNLWYTIIYFRNSYVVRSHIYSLIPKTYREGCKEAFHTSPF